MFVELADKTARSPWAWGLVACAATALVTYAATRKLVPPTVRTETVTQVEFKDRVVVQEKEVVKVEWRDRQTTKNRKVTKPDGTVIQTETVVQEVRQRDVLTDERAVERETEARATQKESRTETGDLPRYSLGVGYSPVVSGSSSAGAWAFSGALRLANTPGWLTLEVIPSTSLLNTRAYIGLRVDF